MKPTDIDSSEIEAKIIEAANFIFLKYGIDTATMAQIAEMVGISRTSLNYYFRSKKHLLKKVLNNLENKIIPTISILVNDENMSICDKIEQFVNEYIDMISKYPMVPSFIVSELNREPDWVINFFLKRKINFEKFSAQINFEVEKGLINSFSLPDLFVNIFGLCVFPLISKPLLMEFFFDQDDNEFKKYLTNRKALVNKVIRSWLVCKI